MDVPRTEFYAHDIVRIELEDAFFSEIEELLFKKSLVRARNENHTGFVLSFREEFLVQGILHAHQDLDRLLFAFKVKRDLFLGDPVFLEV